MIIRIWHDDNDKPVAFLKVVEEDGDFYVDDSECNQRGIGKLLYYHAMNMIYPNYLRPDIDGFSDDALRVWESFKNLDYVESIEDKNHDVLNYDPKVDNNISYFKFRFKFKD